MKTKTYFKVKSYTNRGGSQSWRVEGYTAQGKQIRENYAEKFQAMNRAAELDLERAHAAGLVTLKPTNLTDVELTDAKSALRLLGGVASLVQAAAYYVANYRPGVDLNKSLGDAYAEFIAEKSKPSLNLRPRTLSNLRSRIGGFVKLHTGKKVAAIATDDIQASVHREGYKPQSARNQRRALAGFFRWAVERGYASTNPVSKVGQPKLEIGEPAVLSIDETKRLLAAAVAHKSGALVPYMAIALFAGCRPAEIEGLTWADVSLETKRLKVGSDIAKCRQRRFVDLPDNLVEWLRAHHGKTPILPAGFKKDFAEIRKAAGLNWRPDVMRHSSVSYWMAKHHDEARCAARHGHSATTLHKHYRSSVEEVDGKAYWQLAPNSVISRKGQPEATAAA